MNHSEHHSHGPRDNPPGPHFGQAKVMRGGSYMCRAPTATAFRLAVLGGVSLPAFLRAFRLEAAAQRDGG